MPPFLIRAVSRKILIENIGCDGGITVAVDGLFETRFLACFQADFAHQSRHPATPKNEHAVATETSALFASINAKLIDFASS